MGLNHNTCRICGKYIPDKRLFCDKCVDNIMRRNEPSKKPGLIRRIFKGEKRRDD